MLKQLSLILLYSKFEEVKLELCELFKLLLNPQAKYFNKDFLDVFYLYSLPSLIDFLKISKDTFTMIQVLEILCLCTVTHDEKPRLYLIYEDVLKQLLPLFNFKNKSIRLFMLKLLNAAISGNDNTMNAYIVKNDLLSPVFKYLENKRDNILQAACFEILRKICTEKMQILIEYIMKKYEAVVIGEPYANTEVMKRIVNSKFELSTLKSLRELVDTFLIRKNQENNEQTGQTGQKRIAPSTETVEDIGEGILPKKNMKDD